jgi:hypothetical protein
MRVSSQGGKSSPGETFPIHSSAKIRTLVRIVQNPADAACRKAVGSSDAMTFNTELGPEQACRRCGELWPADAEFL